MVGPRPRLTRKSYIGLCSLASDTESRQAVDLKLRATLWAHPHGRSLMNFKVNAFKVNAFFDIFSFE